MSSTQTPQRRKLIMDGMENFTISETNPNAGVGLPGCLGCGSHRCKGPYMVFPTRVVIPGSRRMAFISISLSCAKKAVVNYERGAEVGVMGSGRPDEEAQINASVADIERAAELLTRLGITIDEDELAEKTSHDNPYFHTGVGREGVPLHRLLDEIRSADALADVPVVEPYDAERAAQVKAAEDAEQQS